VAKKKFKNIVKTILRVSAVFGIQGHNFVKTILRLARERELLRIVNDQVTCPTPAAAIAETLIRVSENPQRGIFHYCGNEPTNWCEFAKDIIEQANHFEPLMVKQIDGIATREYPTPAKRPSYSVLNCEKFKTVFGIQQPDWKLGLNNVITTLYST
jgi:dTDP-4-dehydrorhamnose reductase